MTTVEGYFNRFLSWMKEPKNYRWLVPLLVFIIIIFSVKGCLSRGKNFRGDYLIARDQTWYPLNFYGKESSVLGFSDDLMLQIAKKMGLRVRLVSASPGDLLETLDDSVDGIFSSLTPDVMLQENYLFSEPYYSLGAVLVVDTQSNIKSLADMEGKFIGLKRGSRVLFAIPGHPNMHVVTYDSPITMLDDVVNDKIDGAFLNQLNAYDFTTGYYKGKLRVATPPLTQEGLRLITGVSRRDAALMETFNAGLEEMKKNGTYHALLQKWDLHDPTMQ